MVEMPERPIRVRIVHETNPQKYFPALFDLAASGRVVIAGTHRYSVAKEWLRSGVKDRKGFWARTKDACRDLLFRMRIPFLKGEILVLGFAPWDWRMVFFLPALARNKIVYHTSWPDWRDGCIPRHYWFATPLSRFIWIRVLRHPHVRIVSVLRATQVELFASYGFPSVVIPHAVSPDFFQTRNAAGHSYAEPLRLLFVGELSRKKGIYRLLRIMRHLSDVPVELTIVGDGPLRSVCADAATASNVRFLGPIRNRSQLAAEMASHDVLVLLSVRERRWQELFGIVVTEALAAGLGVIATEHVGPASIFYGHDLGNLFPQDDDRGPERLIEQLARDPRKRALFKLAHQGIASDYRSSEVAEQWARVLDAPTGRTSSD